MSGNSNQVPLAPSQRGPGPHTQHGHGAIEVVHSLQTTMNMPQPVGQQITLNQINLQPLNNVSLHFINNPNTLKHEHTSSRYSNSNFQPSHHYRLVAQSRGECYQQSGATSSGYMQAGTPGGAQNSAQATMRVQPQQTQVPPQQQQDMSKNTMPTHNFAPAQNQSAQARPQYANYQYRTAQHGNRPASHPRQQQQFIQGGAATGMYPTLMFPPMSMPGASYPQHRGQGYYPYMAQLQYSYATTPPSHTQSYYYPTANSQQIQAPNLGANTPGRANASGLVGPQGTPTAPTAQNTAMAHQQQTPSHMHPNMQGDHTLLPSHNNFGMRPAQAKRSHRLKIIHPVTRQDILSDISNESQYVSGESSERQTPQPEIPTPSGISIAEEFNRMVNEVAKQSSDSTIKSNYNTKNIDIVTTSNASHQPQTNAPTSANNNLVKSDLLPVNEHKNIGPDLAVEPCETPVVSAISDNPVIVPQLPTIVKQAEKNSEKSIQPLVLDTNKNVTTNKPQKHKVKQVPHVDEVEKTIESSVGSSMPPPQPQRIREPRERIRSEDKDADYEKELTSKANGPPKSDRSVETAENLADVVKPQASQINAVKTTESLHKQVVSQQPPATQEIVSVPSVDSKIGRINCDVAISPFSSPPTATELLSASIEKAAKENYQEIYPKEPSSAFEAQVKLTKSITSCCSNHPESNMKDINLNNQATDLDADTANGNSDASNAKADSISKEEANSNEKSGKNSKNMSNKVAANSDETASYDNGKDETDKVSNVEQEDALSDKEDATTMSALEDKPQAPTVFVPKYKYNDDQWSPMNMSGKKCYDLGLLKQIKDDPLSKNKPDIPMLATLKVVRETMAFTPILRPINDSLFPSFAKGTGVVRAQGRDIKKDGRTIVPSGKGSVKLTPNQSSSGSHKPVIHVSLSLREDVKLNKTENAWKPNRFKKDSISEEEFKTQDLYKKFRGILNKLTPQKFDTLMDRVKLLEINNQKRLDGVIDLVFEKAIEEPNFSEAYAALCNKLCKLKVPADNAVSPDQCVNFRALIINKCQKQFTISETDKNIVKLEKDLNECTDPAKRKELAALLNDENRRVRMRSVGNVRFIGELYKLQMLTSKIMVYCMNSLIDKLEEEKLECLCKLLTTIGEQVEGEVRDQLDAVFKKMQDIVDRKSNKISSRVRFMIQDVIELRKRQWVIKSVVDSQPKMMDQIQKEAEQQQRQIELMNSNPMSSGGGFRRDEGGRGKRGGDGRRQNSNNFMDNNSNNWKTTSSRNYSVDMNKLKAATNNKNLTGIKLAPQNSGWNHGSGTKNTAQAASTSQPATTTTNMYSVLAENMTDPISLRVNKDVSAPGYGKGASIERSTFSSRTDFSSGSGSRSGSMGLQHSTATNRSTAGTPVSPLLEVPASAPAPVPIVAQEPLTDAQKKTVKSFLDLCIINSDCDEMVSDVKQVFGPSCHAGIITEILNAALELSSKDIGMVSKAMLALVSSGTIASENVLVGFTDIFELGPDLFIDVPMLYEFIGKILSPLIEKKHITFAQILRLCGTISAANQSQLLLRAIIKNMKEDMGPTFVKNKWIESGSQFTDWMKPDQVSKFIEDNKLEFLQGEAKPSDEIKNNLTPVETQVKLLQLMNSDENCECIRGWVQDNLGKSSNEDWFMRSLIQAICEHALFGPEGREVPHFNQERMNKYSGLINEFGETKQAREANCLVGIQQLIHRLEHPQGLTLEIFQYLHEQYLISVEGFISWETSLEPGGKGVMLKALTSFFTNIKEADNEDSCSED